MSLKIVIPSHKRHDRVFSKKLVTDPIICVAKSQADIYREYNPECEIVCHPDSVVGLIPKRNWMAKHFGDLFMFDDDVHVCKRLFTEYSVFMDDRHIRGSLEAALRANSDADRYNVPQAERDRIAGALRSWYLQEHRDYKEPVRQLDLFEDYQTDIT